MEQSAIQKLIRYFKAKYPGESLVALESQLPGHPSSNRSYIAARPEVVISAKNDRIHITAGGKVSERTGNPWEELKQFRREHGEWMFGYLGYDLKNHTEKLTSENPDLTAIPDLWMMVPGFLAEVTEEGVRLIRGDLAELKLALESNEAYNSALPLQLNRIEPLEDEKNYVNKIEKIQELIREGEFYELNYAYPIRAEFSGEGIDLYEAMKRVNPVPFASYISFNGREVICSSPERFLQKSGRKLLSEPIKGTAERSEHPADDRKRKEELLSEKNRAENLMIVDLVRHDLSLISEPGSVTVEKLFDIQTFGTVHQLISSITSTTKADADPVDIIRACFPMGSMTGAPKIRVMEAIDQLEIFRRGIYSGAIGYFTPDGDFDLNVVIRTAIAENGQLIYPTGGAITSDSVAQDEWMETKIKARALTKVFEETPLSLK